MTLGIPNDSFVAEDRFETGKQKFLIISNLTLYYTTYSINALCIMNPNITHKYNKILKLREGNCFTKKLKIKIQVVQCRFIVEVLENFHFF